MAIHTSISYMFVGIYNSATNLYTPICICILIYEYKLCTMQSVVVIGGDFLMMDKMN